MIALSRQIRCPVHGVLTGWVRVVLDDEDKALLKKAYDENVLASKLAYDEAVKNYQRAHWPRKERRDRKLLVEATNRFSAESSKTLIPREPESNLNGLFELLRPHQACGLLFEEI